MITRIWHGWATHENAPAYEALLRAEILPDIGERVDGYLGAFVLRRDAGDEVEFVTLTQFDSWDAVRAFAGEDYERAVVVEEGRRLLSRFDERSQHYETILSPGRAS